MIHLVHTNNAIDYIRQAEYHMKYYIIVLELLSFCPLFMLIIVQLFDRLRIIPGSSPVCLKGFSLDSCHPTS